MKSVSSTFVLWIVLILTKEALAFPEQGKWEYVLNEVCSYIG